MCSNVWESKITFLWTELVVQVSVTNHRRISERKNRQRESAREKWSERKTDKCALQEIHERQGKTDTNHESNSGVFSNRSKKNLWFLLMWCVRLVLKCFECNLLRKWIRYCTRKGGSMYVYLSRCSFFCLFTDAMIWIDRPDRGC